MATAATEFDPIDAFVGTGSGAKKLEFKKAYTYTLNDVINFLKDASDNPVRYGVPDWERRQPDLKMVYNLINSLKVGGDYYNNPRPVQQILRKATIRTGGELEPTAVIPWATTDQKKVFWIIFDLLGLFFSLMGPATAGATAKNYFLPLVVIYARWCFVLSDARSGKAPKIVQVTWVTKGNRQYPFLGASAGGFVPNWGEWVKKKRHCVVTDILQRPFTAYDDSPVFQRDGASGWNLGNCAETYPFLYLLTDATVKESSFGISVEIGKTSSHATYDGKACWEGPLKVVRVPCLNCKTLLGWLGLEAREKDKCFELWNKK